MEDVGRYIGIANMEFVYKSDRTEYSYKHDAMSNTEQIFVKVFKGDVDKEYPFYYYLSLYQASYHYHIRMLGKADVGEKLKLIYECKRNLLRIIDRGKLIIKNQPHSYDYRFDSIIELIDSEIEKLKAELDVYKYELEVKKLRSETAWYKEPIFMVLFAIAIMSFFISTCGPFNSPHPEPHYRTADSAKGNNNNTPNQK